LNFSNEWTTQILRQATESENKHRKYTNFAGYTDNHEETNAKMSLKSQSLFE